jgi:hypothetical protein
MSQYPTIQKTVRKFILNENGSITKANLVKISVLVAGSLGFIAQETARAATPPCHASDAITITKQNVGNINPSHSNCGAMHDSAHASHSSHCSGDWCSHGNSVGLTQGKAYSCSAHDNILTMSASPDYTGMVNGTHAHAVTHQNSPANTAVACADQSCINQYTARRDGVNLYHCSHCNHSSG